MTFPTGGVKMGYSEDEICTILSDSEQARNHGQKLAKVTETVAAYRLREMKDLQAREKLATLRRINGFDRVADGEDNWFYGPRSLPPISEEFTSSLCPEVNALKAAISTLVIDGSSWQELKRNLVRRIERDEVSDEGFAIIKRVEERRGREAAQATATPVSTVQHCIPRLLNPEMLPDVCVSLESYEGKMDPELTELEPPSAGMGLETPGQQCPPNEGVWEKG